MNPLTALPADIGKQMINESFVTLETSSIVSPFLQLPLEIREQIYHESFAIRDPPFDFDYRLRHGCVRQTTSARRYCAIQDPEDGHEIMIQYFESYEHCPIAMGCKYQMQGFLALRLANRQIYHETYNFIKLPPISVRAAKITSSSMSSLQQQLARPYLRDHVKELIIAFYPCEHTSNMQRLQISMLKKDWFSKLTTPLACVFRAAWISIQVAWGALCQGCQVASIQPLLELLATCPLLKNIQIEVVSVCHIRDRGGCGDLKALNSLRGLGVKMDLSYHDEEWWNKEQ